MQSAQPGSQLDQYALKGIIARSNTDLLTRLDIHAGVKGPAQRQRRRRSKNRTPEPPVACNSNWQAGRISFEI
jgi:hypothetical protein